MAIRKEQTLLLLALVFGYWMYSGITEVKKAKVPRPSNREYELPPGFDPITVTTTGPKNLRELFVEPSESRPLPPRDDLEFPTFEQLPVVLLPLEIGQQPPAYSGLRHAALLQGKNSAPAPAAAVNPAPPAANGNAAGGIQIDPGRGYDTLVRVLGGMNNKFYGLFLGEDSVKFDLAGRPGPYEGVIRFQWINEKTRKTIRVLEESGEAIAQLRIAKTLRNEIGMRLHKFKPSTTNIGQQRTELLYLLDKARIESWVYDRALERVEAYMGFAKPKEEGLLYKAIVLRAKGDLPGEYKLFRDLDKDAELQGSSFQFRGLGVVEAKLGLDKLAEKHLKRAVAISSPIDPRNYAALATFYLDRGRAREALDPASKAERFKIRRDPTAAEQVGFEQVHVRALLAVGDLEGAARHSSKNVAAAQQRQADYQEACIAYAMQQHATAEPLFQEIYNSGRMPSALLGLAACQIATGNFADGLDNLKRVVDEHPRQRHLGLAGLGLALSSGSGDDALEKIDAGILTFPNHPYLLYLQGRQRRLNDDLEGAVEPLRKALRLHDDFLEALAELTITYYALYDRNQDAGALISALRYVDRLADLDQSQGGKADLFLEMQGKIHYEARDIAGARAAFKRGEKTSLICQIGLAILDYAQKRQIVAETRLEMMKRDLPPGHKIRAYIEHLLSLMIRHSNKEQVIDRFDRSELGKAWEGGKRNNVQAAVADGELRFKGNFGRDANRPVTAPRYMQGPGRFLSVSVEMKIGDKNSSRFAGFYLSIPSRGRGSTRFSLRVGMDDRDQVVVELNDGRARLEPIRTNIKVTKGEWHRILITVDDEDDADPKDTSRYLRVFFDGRSLVPKELSKLKTLRRSDNKSNQFLTEFRVESNPLTYVDVSFDNYVRIQEKKK